MIQNYIKIALRTFLRQTKYSVINALSLITAIFIAYLGFGYVNYEYSFDNYHANADDTYRLARTYRSQDYSIIGFPSWSESDANEQQLQVKNLEATPLVEDVVQFVTTSTNEYLELTGNKVEESKLLSTNTPEAFVNVFSWKLINGSFKNFTKGEKKVILTASTAKKIFGDNEISNPSLINIPIKHGASTYSLAAIIEDVPSNSHFDFNVALSEDRLDYWGSRIYIKGAKNASRINIEAQINKTIAAYNPRLATDELYNGHFLQPIRDIHLHSNLLYELKPPGNLIYIKLIGFFAIFVLIINLFNNSNLSIAIKSRQAKAIGVQKALGALNGQVIMQFLWEGIILATLCLPFVLVLIYAGVPYFNNLMGVSIAANLLLAPKSLMLVTLAMSAISAIASIAPGIYFTLKDTSNLFKENLNSRLFQNMTVRKYLIVSQFVILITITSISFFISQQLDYIKTKEVGFQKEGILYAYSSEKNSAVFQQKLKQIPEIKNVGNGSSFAIEPYNQMTYKLEGDEDVFDDARELYLDAEAVKAYQLKTNLANIPDKRVTLINRTAAIKLAEYKKISVEDLVGKTIITEPEYINETTGQVGIPFVIAGIFEDINIFSLHKKIEPYFLTIAPDLNLSGRAIISFLPKDEDIVLAKVTKAYASLNEVFPLETELLNQNINQLYKQDEQTSDLLIYINIIAVILASLGLLGIAIFLTIARTKEIGIRKVLGASIYNIVKSITQEYIWLVASALALSWPIAFYILKIWLSSFAYQINITHIIFLIIGLITALWTSVIVGSIALKAALVNPVESLKSE